MKIQTNFKSLISSFFNRRYSIKHILKDPDAKISFNKRFFYIKNDTKHFIDVTECEKTENGYFFDESGHRQISVYGEKYPIYTEFTNDNSLLLKLDRSKDLYLNEEKYEKCYFHQGIKYDINLKKHEHFEQYLFKFRAYFVFSSSLLNILR